MNSELLNSLAQRRTSKIYKREIAKKLFFFLRGHYATLLDFINSNIHATNEKMDSTFDVQKKELLAITSRLSTIETKIHHITNTLGTTGFSSSTPIRISALNDKSYNSLDVDVPNTPLSFYTGKYGNFILRKNDLVGDCIRSNNFWDKHLETIIEKYSSQEKIAIDAGAFVGFHTCFMARHFSKVISFEPQQEIFKILQANTLLNGINNAVLHNKALYSQDCHMRIAGQVRQEVLVPLKENTTVDYSEAFNSAALNLEQCTEDVPESVKAIAIDSLNLENVGLIKVDTQGSVLQLLMGAKRTISRCKPIIIFEYEKELALTHKNHLHDYQDFFQQLGYSLTLLSNKEGKQLDCLAEPAKTKQVELNSTSVPLTASV